MPQLIAGVIEGDIETESAVGMHGLNGGKAGWGLGGGRGRGVVGI